MITFVVNMVLRQFTLRLALLLLPWLVILAVPRFRQQMWVTAFSFHYSGKDPFTPWVGLFGDRSVRRDNDDPTTPEQEAMNVVWGAGPQYRLHSGNRSLFRIQEFGRVSDKYPREAWIVALALRHFESFSDGRVEYVLTQPSISTTMTQVNEVKPAALKEAYRLVRRGQSLEPDNAFFDWMEVRLLIISRRDREALELLQRLVRKPRYNEHFRELITAQIADIEARRPVLPDERPGTTLSTLLPELSLYKHSRGTILWRMDQLEGNHRHDEAIAIGRALRRLCVMQMRAAPFAVNAVSAATGLRGVWEGNDRHRVLSAGRPSNLSSSDAPAALVAQRYFQYLRAHGHPELVPEAQAELRQYEIVEQWEKGPRNDDFLAPARNFELALSDVYWAGGGLALVGVLLSSGLWLVLFPFGCRADFRPPAPIVWPPPRRAFYLQLVAWAAAVICAAYAAVLCLGEMEYPESAGQLSLVVLGLPFAGALVTHLLGLRSEKRPQPAKYHWVPEFRELGMPAPIVDVLGRTWRVFGMLVLLLALLCAPLTVVTILDVFKVTWTGWMVIDLFGVYTTILPFTESAYIAPALLMLWAVFAFAAWYRHSRLNRASIFNAIRGFRIYSGAYATVFSWLILVALYFNSVPEAVLDRGFAGYLRQVEKLTYMTPAPTTLVPVRALPPIPVFPTPTPTPIGVYPVPASESEE